MHEWLALLDLGARSPGLVFAAGALTVTLLQCAVAGAGWIVRRRAQVFPPDDPRRIWTELRQLRADCAASTGNLEILVAQLKDRTTAHLDERAGGAHELQRLQGALDARTETITALERQIAELELVQVRHLLELQRKDDELGSRTEALASAEQTIVLLRGMLDVSRRAQPRIADRAAG